MGAIITRYAFPRDVPRQDYRALLGQRLRELTVGEGARRRRIYAAVYEPPTPAACTLVYSHGNGETLYTIHWVLEQHCAALGANIVAYDWEGYGLSEGRADEAALLRAAERVLSAAAEMFPHTRLIAWGRSIGSVAAAHQGRLGVAAVVLQSPLASAFAVVCTRPCCLCADQLRNVVTVRGLGCPVWVVHGDADGIVPYSNALRIFESYRESFPDRGEPTGPEAVMERLSVRRYHRMRLYTISGGGHNNLETARRRQLYRALRELLGLLAGDGAAEPSDELVFSAAGRG